MLCCCCCASKGCRLFLISSMSFALYASLRAFFCSGGAALEAATAEIMKE